jgi:hypothetical protein
VAVRPKDVDPVFPHIERVGAPEFGSVTRLVAPRPRSSLALGANVEVHDVVLFVGIQMLVLAFHDLFKLKRLYRKLIRQTFKRLALPWIRRRHTHQSTILGIGPELVQFSADVVHIFCSRPWLGHGATPHSGLRFADHNSRAPPMLIPTDASAERPVTHCSPAWAYSYCAPLLGLKHSVSKIIKFRTLRRERSDKLAQSGGALVHLIKAVHEVSPIGGRSDPTTTKQPITSHNKSS